MFCKSAITHMDRWFKQNTLKKTKWHQTIKSFKRHQKISRKTTKKYLSKIQKKFFKSHHNFTFTIMFLMLIFYVHYLITLFYFIFIIFLCLPLTFVLDIVMLLLSRVGDLGGKISCDLSVDLWWFITDEESIE